MAKCNQLTSLPFKGLKVDHLCMRAFNYALTSRFSAPVILTYKCDPDILKVYLHTKNEVLSQCF